MGLGGNGLSIGVDLCSIKGLFGLFKLNKPKDHSCNFCKIED